MSQDNPRQDNGGSPGEEPQEPKRSVLPDIDYEIRPDWTNIWTAEDAERELENLKFTGPGWYFIGEDVLLVLATGAITPGTSPWSQSGWEPGQLFRFCVYNERNPCQVFNSIVNAPVRMDTRGECPHGTPKSQRCEQCVNEGAYTHAIPINELKPDPGNPEARAFDDTDLQGSFCWLAFTPSSS